MLLPSTAPGTGQVLAVTCILRQWQDGPSPKVVHMAPQLTLALDTLELATLAITTQALVTLVLALTIQSLTSLALITSALATPTLGSTAPDGNLKLEALTGWTFLCSCAYSTSSNTCTINTSISNTMDYGCLSWSYVVLATPALTTLSLATLVLLLKS